MSYSIQDENTIAAISTAVAAGQGGIAIIRISGSEAKEVGQSVVSTPNHKNWESHQIMYGNVYKKNTKEKIDEVLVFFMQSPRSFTGEDVIEIHCHGGLISVQRVLQQVLDHSKVRRALPGEFSQRAVFNGRLKLTQAESINDLISARSHKAAQLAMHGVDGGIQKSINLLREKLLDQLSELEVRVDFEDELPTLIGEEVLKEIQRIRIALMKLVNDAMQSRLLSNGINIAIVGRPNVGKSSLLNRLSKREKAIVTNLPGTTRDPIESKIILKGVPINLIDTAGIRSTNDEVERLGIEKSQNTLLAADLILLIFDLNSGWTDEDNRLLSKLPKESSVLIVGNKSDTLKENALGTKKKELCHGKSDIIFSSLTGDGEGVLIEEILKRCGAEDIQSMQIALNERQTDLARKAVQSLEKVDKTAKENLPWDFWTIDLRQAIQALGEITGEEISENLLSKIFSRFCIGK
tara:strand:+ start:406 stop:1800 length:1395 start_codon:yes stop_codon:yes gene_type:complete